MVLSARDGLEKKKYRYFYIVTITFVTQFAGVITNTAICIINYRLFHDESRSPYMLLRIVWIPSLYEINNRIILRVQCTIRDKNHEKRA